MTKVTSLKAAFALLVGVAAYAPASGAKAHDVWSNWFVRGPAANAMNQHPGLWGRVWVGYNQFGTWIDATRAINDSGVNAWMQANQFCNDGTEDWSTAGVTASGSTRTTTTCSFGADPSWGRGLLGEP